MPIPEGVESNLPGGKQVPLDDTREILVLVPINQEPTYVIRLNRNQRKALAELPYVEAGLSWIWSRLEAWLDRKNKKA